MLPKSRTEGLLVSESPEGLRIVDTTCGATHSLDPISAAVFRHADGQTPVPALVACASVAVAAPVDDTAVWGALDKLADMGLLEQRVAPPVASRRVGRREVIARMALGTAAAGAVAAVAADSAFAGPPQEQATKLAARQEQDNKQAAQRQEQGQKREARAEQDRKTSEAQRQEQLQKRQAHHQEEKLKRAQERNDKRLHRRGGEPLALRNGWDNVGDPYLQASVARFGRLVSVSGMVTGALAYDPVIGVLPENCRPNGQLVFLQYGQTAAAPSGSSDSVTRAPGTVRVDVTALGEVIVVPSVAEFVSLSGISFIADLMHEQDDEDGCGDGTGGSSESDTKANQEAQTKASQETQDKSSQEAQAKASQEAQDKANQEAQAKANQETQDKASQETQAKAGQEAQAKTSQETQDKAAQEAQAKASQETQAKAAQEAQAKASQEAQAKAAQEAQAKASQEAQLKASQETQAKESAKSVSEQEAKYAAAERVSKSSAEQAAKASGAELASKASAAEQASKGGF